MIENIFSPSLVEIITVDIVSMVFTLLLFTILCIINRLFINHKILYNKLFAKKLMAYTKAKNKNNVYFKIPSSLSVPVNEKHFIGIGKFKFKPDYFSDFHFMLDETSTNNYEATLLEFELVSWSETINGAIKNLICQTYSYILSFMLKSHLNNISKEVNNHIMDNYWRNYRELIFYLGSQHRMLYQNMDRQLVQEINILIADETKHIIYELNKEENGNDKEKNSNTVEESRILPFTLYSLTYTKL